jgi:hypothetical protein
VVAVTSASGQRIDPAPLFDQVTGFPPDDAVDVTVPMPLTLAFYMTMLESTGHAAELATLRKIYVDEARELARGIQAAIADLTALGEATTARLRITHIVEERVPGVNGLRPHVHAYVGSTVRSPDGVRTPVDVDALTRLTDTDLLPDARRRIAAVTTQTCGLTWGETTSSSCEVLEPRWLVDRAARARQEEPLCRGPWPRQRQIVAGRRPSPG